MNKYLYIISIILFVSNQDKAQDNGKIIQEFNTSYKTEYYKNYAEAIKAMDAIYSPESYEINLRLGWLHYNNGNYSKSESYYKKSIELAPKSIEAKFGLANVLAALEYWDQLLILYKDIVKLDPKNSIANYRIAYLLYSQKKMSSALNYITQTLELYPFDYNSNLLAGKIYISLGDITKARDVLKKAQMYNPKATEVEQLLNGL